MHAALLVLMALVAVTTAAVIADNTSYSFLVIGDWGGKDPAPYTEPGQVACAASMGPVATEINYADNSTTARFEVTFYVRMPTQLSSTFYYRDEFVRTSLPSARAPTSASTASPR